jgi:hypothetical protein
MLSRFRRDFLADVGQGMLLASVGADASQASATNGMVSQALAGPEMTQ